VLAGGIFSRKQSQVKSTPAKQSSSSDDKNQQRAASSPLRSLSVVAGGKLQTSGSVRVTLIKGSLVQQKVNVSAD